MGNRVSESITVVYVEDDPDLRALIEIVFERAGALRMVTCESTPDVLDRIRDAQPDIVLLDVMMPGLDGRAVASGMLADPALAHVPFVFMTARAQPQELAGLYQLGAIGLISKPFDAVKLPDEVRRLLAKYRGGHSGAAEA